MTMIKGKAWKFGNDVNTDEIIPARYLNTSDSHELAKHCMENVNADFARRVTAGDVIIAGRNFGCGSSREHAPLAIKHAGASCVVAESFARIFFRNSINIGLSVFECAEAAKNISLGDDVEIELTTGRIRNATTGMSYQAAKPAKLIQDIILNGGLMEYLKKRRKRERELRGKQKL